MSLKASYHKKQKSLKAS